MARISAPVSEIKGIIIRLVLFLEGVNFDKYAEVSPSRSGVLTL
jgi:hypothetical protein